MIIYAFLQADGDAAPGKWGGEPTELLSSQGNRQRPAARLGGYGLTSLKTAPGCNTLYLVFYTKTTFCSLEKCVHLKQPSERV